MNSDGRERNIPRHFPSTSETNERYNRGDCANALLLSNAFTRRLVSGWIVDSAFHLPETAHVTERTGKNGIARIFPGPIRSAPIVEAVATLEIPGELAEVSPGGSAGKSGRAPDDADSPETERYGAVTLLALCNYFTDVGGPQILATL